MSRPYTGNKDGLAKGATAGLLALVDEISKKSGGALWNNGTFVNRPMRGKASLSVHATGRAADVSWRKLSADKGKKNGREYAETMMNFLVQHADALGLEMCIDYFPKPYGRAWRCDRNAWQVYESEVVHGAPNGDWFHAEVSPEMAKKPEAIREIFAKHWIAQPIQNAESAQPEPVSQSAASQEEKPKKLGLKRRNRKKND